MLYGNITLGIFALILLAALITGIPLYWAVGAGLVLFCVYARLSGYHFREIIKMVIDGLKKSLNVLEILCLIGILTAVWRASGTIPLIVSVSAKMIVPSIFLLLAFWFNCAVSFLTGTSFGTVATMGTICMSISAAMGLDPVISGGAIISGIWFGDRCSPVSSSALLSADLTETNIYENVKAMAKDAAVPFAITSAVYLIIGFVLPHNNAEVDLFSLFSVEFKLEWIEVLPAVLILVLALLKVPSKITISISILAAFFIALTIQHETAKEMLLSFINGFKAEDEAVAAMLNGGGILSMKNSLIIVALSCSYSVIFKATGMLNGIRIVIRKLSDKITPYGSMLVSGVFSSMLACNQTFAQIMTHQICSPFYEDKKQCLLDLEDTAVLVAALIPWTVASSIPISTLGCGSKAILFAFYLWIIPLYRLTMSLISAGKQHKTA